jgi:hypothetical protein
MLKLMIESAFRQIVRYALGVAGGFGNQTLVLLPFASCYSFFVAQQGTYFAAKYVESATEFLTTG